MSARTLWHSAMAGARPAALRPALHFVDCLVSMVHTKVLGRTPVRPWLPYEVQGILWRELGPGDRVFEWGAGGSTIWLARKGCRVWSVESHPKWTEKLGRLLERQGLADRVRIETRGGREPRRTEDGPYLSGHEDHVGECFREYVEVIDHFPDGHFDAVIVDGRARSACVAHGRSKVAPGGLLILDDSHRERYRDAAASLEPWPRTDHDSLQPFKLRFEQCSVWRRPGDG